MATVQQWGRKESIIWPPRGYVYTLGTFIFSCILTGIFIYIRFQYGLSPLQRYYLPYCLPTETAGLTHPVSQCQLLYISAGEKPPFLMGKASKPKLLPRLRAMCDATCGWHFARAIRFIER